MKVKCLECGQVVGKQGAHQHMRYQHRIENAVEGVHYTEVSSAGAPTDKQNWECLVCGEVFEGRRSVIVHVSRGHKKKITEKSRLKYIRPTDKQATKTKQPWRKWNNKNKTSEKPTSERQTITHETRMIEIPVTLQVPVVIGKAIIKGE